MPGRKRGAGRGTSCGEFAIMANRTSRKTGRLENPARFRVHRNIALELTLAQRVNAFLNAHAEESFGGIVQQAIEEFLNRKAKLQP